MILMAIGKALKAYKAGLKKSKDKSESVYDDFISENPIVTHKGYEVRMAGSHQSLYNTLVYHDDLNVLEGLKFVHELQNLCLDKLAGYLFLEEGTYKKDN